MKLVISRRLFLFALGCAVSVRFIRSVSAEDGRYLGNNTSGSRSTSGSKAPEPRTDSDRPRDRGIVSSLYSTKTSALYTRDAIERSTMPPRCEAISTTPAQSRAARRATHSPRDSYERLAEENDAIRALSTIGEWNYHLSKTLKYAPPVADAVKPITGIIDYTLLASEFGVRSAINIGGRAGPDFHKIETPHEAVWKMMTAIGHGFYISARDMLSAEGQRELRLFGIENSPRTPDLFSGRRSREAIEIFPIMIQPAPIRSEFTGSAQKSRATEAAR